MPHAHLSGFVADPVLFCRVGRRLLLLTLPANTSSQSIANRAASLVPMLWILLFHLLGWCGSTHLIDRVDCNRESPLAAGDGDNGACCCSCRSITWRNFTVASPESATIKVIVNQLLCKLFIEEPLRGVQTMLRAQ